MSASKKPILVSVHQHKYPDIQAFLSEHNVPFYFQSFIKLQFLPFTIPEDTNWIFVSSPNVMPHLLEHTKYPKKYKWAVVGQSSAKRLKALGITASFIGVGPTDSLANQFLTCVLSGEKTWFPISNLSKRSVQKKLNPLEFKESVVYLNEAIPINEDYKSFIGNVFLTSPSNAKNFLEQHVNMGADCSLFAIGETTMEEIVKFGLKATCSSGYESKDILQLFKELYT